MLLNSIRNGKIGILLLLGIVALSLTFPRTGSSHEPITTKVMFNKEVIRILQTNCLGCHSEGHVKADIPLTTYEEARPWAKAIKEEVLEKRMMPYQAVKGYGEFQHDYGVPQRDVELLVSWVDGGAPKGDEKDYPKESIQKLIKGDNWQQGPPDLVIQPQKEFRISPEGKNGENEVRCVSIATGLKEDKVAATIDFKPGNGAIVQSASLYLERPSVRKAVKAASNKCEMTQGAELLSTWIPGSRTGKLPEGYGFMLPAGSKVLMKINYRKSDEEATDLSSFGLYFSKGGQIGRVVQDVAVKSNETVIPANADRHKVKASYLINENTEAIAIRPVLFPFAKSVEAAAFRPDGTVEVLIWARNYKYNWQPQYFFKKPVNLPKGTRIEVSAYLDNSDKNPNNPNDSSKSHKFADTVCELTLATAAQPLRQAKR